MEPFAFMLILNTMKKKLLIGSLCHLLLYPIVGYSTEMLTCSFRDSQNAYREFMLKRTGDKDKTFKDVNFVEDISLDDAETGTKFAEYKFQIQNRDIFQ